MSDYTTIRDSRTLAARLRQEFPEAEDALADTVDGETDVTNALYRVLISAEDDRTSQAAIAIRIAELEERKDRFGRAEERKRALVLGAMLDCGIRFIDRPELRATVTPSPAKVIITDEPAIPAAYLKTVTSPMKAEIMRALKSGVKVPGCEMSNPASHLVVKRS